MNGKSNARAAASVGSKYSPTDVLPLSRARKENPDAGRGAGVSPGGSPPAPKRTCGPRDSNPRPTARSNVSCAHRTYFPLCTGVLTPSRALLTMSSPTSRRAASWKVGASPWPARRRAASQVPRSLTESRGRHAGYIQGRGALRGVARAGKIRSRAASPHALYHPFARQSQRPGSCFGSSPAEGIHNHRASGPVRVQRAASSFQSHQSRLRAVQR